MKTNKPKLISLDFDDCLYDLMSLNVRYVKDNYGVINIHRKIKNYYHIYHTYPSIGDDLWNHPENYIQGKLLQGAKEFYIELVDYYGVDAIQIVTSSMENIVDVKNEMIREKFGITCDIKHSIFNKISKHELTGNTVLVDDHIDNVINHVEFNDASGIIFNYMDLDYIKERAILIDGKYQKISYANDYETLLRMIHKKVAMRKK